jgi:hypothetical protein
MLNGPIRVISSHFLEVRNELINPELGVRILDSSARLGVFDVFNDTRASQLDLFLELQQNLLF